MAFSWADINFTLIYFKFGSKKHIILKNDGYLFS